MTEGTRAKSRRLTGAAWLVLAIVSSVTLLTGMVLAPRAEICTQEPSVTLNFVGDILLASSVGTLIAREGPVAPWEGVKATLAEADFTVGNLECAVGTTGTPTPDKSYTFRADPVSVQGLVEAGFDLVSLANNHTLDFGTECMLETIEHVSAAGIVPIGAGKDEASARAPHILEKNGIKIGFLATNMVVPTIAWAAKGQTPGMAVDYSVWNDNIVSRIRDLSNEADIVVVLIHWGEERKTQLEDWVVSMEETLRQAGADIIIGTHPHVLQGIRYDGETVTAHSLGNFVFTTRDDFPACQAGGILRISVSSKGIREVQFLPTKIVWGKTHMVSGQEKSSAIASLAVLSRPFGADLDPEGFVLPISFADMWGHWARFTVARMSRIGIVEGYDDGKFRPERQVTKGEFAALFSRAMAEPQELESATDPESFDLCPAGHWAYPYLRYLASQGWISPSDQSWVPDLPCSRGDVARIMWMAKGCPATPDGSPNATERFSDLAELDPQLLAVASWATSSGLLKGYPDNTLRLEGTITRAEVCEMLWRYCRLLW
jgi:poly-gamma-glutamate capsule biosynthesis protein CapA/YwtB (metallophosphatase superfamily)